MNKQLREICNMVSHSKNGEHCMMIINCIDNENIWSLCNFYIGHSQSGLLFTVIRPVSQQWENYPKMYGQNPRFGTQTNSKMFHVNPPAFKTCFGMVIHLSSYPSSIAFHQARSRAKANLLSNKYKMKM